MSTDHFLQMSVPVTQEIALVQSVTIWKLQSPVNKVSVQSSKVPEQREGVSEQADVSQHVEERVTGNAVVTQELVNHSGERKHTNSLESNKGSLIFSPSHRSFIW